MTNARGKPKKGKLADMTILPPPDPVYALPPPEECEDIEGGEILSINHELRTRFKMWDDRYMVEFAIMQYYRGSGKWEQVARIDTCHGRIHRHQLLRGSDDDRGEVHDIRPIPADNGWEVVDTGYDEALKLMRANWREHLREGGWSGA